MTTQKTQSGQKANSQTFQNPFASFDVGQLMSAFDPSKFADEFTKMAGRYQMPGVDMEAMAEAHRRNVEAVNAANHAVQEGARKLAKRQGEIMEQALTAARAAFAQFGKAGSPQEAAAQQAALAKDVFEAAVANTQELAELAAKTNAETAEVITGRISEGLEELKALAGKLKK
jgi:phasin family protein